MKITYLGHATFLIEGGGTKILIDPYDEKVGYPIPSVDADAVLVSHEHGDHTNVAMAKGKPSVVRGLADGDWRKIVKQPVGQVSVSSVPTYHDDTQGSQRGRNTVFVLETEGLRVVHLADLGHLLDQSQVTAIGRPDVVMIPVGGHYTIDAAQAKQVLDQLQPKVVIPMHYKTEVNAGWPIGDLNGFLGVIGETKNVGHTVTVDRATLPTTREVWVMSWK
ncbi:MAG TPA: MBL fold metallo-hydrolase [bacterium]|nr:MBL fold metallo-hydrolase [bacterium]